MHNRLSYYLRTNNILAGHGSRAVACILFARSEAGTVGSNPTRHGCLVFVNVYVFFYVCVQVEALR
jgi:hypothetical protein